MLPSDINANFCIWQEQRACKDFAFDDGYLQIKSILLPYTYSDIADITMSWGKQLTITFCDDLSVGISITGTLFYCGKERGNSFPEEDLENMRCSIQAYRRENAVFSLGEIFQMRAYDDFEQHLETYLSCLPSCRESAEELLGAYYKFGDLSVLVKLLTDLITFLSEQESDALIRHHRKKYSIPLF